MKKMLIKVLSLLLLLTICIQLIQPYEQPIYAQMNVDAQGAAGEVTDPITKEDKPYLALGANLSSDEKNTVLNLLGIQPLELSDYNVIYITNEQEYQYLGSYIPPENIGSKSLSSVLVVKREKEHGINITTKNISYCTIGMYKNALITAGIKDADIIVAGPFSISGTAALVGAMKAYAVMTNEVVSQHSMDAALNELVVTGNLAEKIGDSNKIEEFMAYLKHEMIQQKLSTTAAIQKLVKKASNKYNLKLTANEREQLVKLLKKIEKLDLDLDMVTSQARELYDKIDKVGKETGFFKNVKNFFGSLGDSVKEWFD
jgi:uncharacterized protein YpuA (DUF1002 family)